jgi:hypothetical protein
MSLPICGGFELLHAATTGAWHDAPIILKDTSKNVLNPSIFWGCRPFSRVRIATIVTPQDGTWALSLLLSVSGMLHLRM